MPEQYQQYLRKFNLVVAVNDKGIDLSEFHCKFQVIQGDQQSPNNTAIRVYNLSQDTIKKIKGEYTRVILQAGYENGAYGVIFDGTIKQFRVGRENATDTYLDILAAEFDLGYNFGVVNQTLAAGATPTQVVQVTSNSMNVQIKYIPENFGGTLPRGKVLFGLGRDVMREVSQTNLCSWSVQNGKMQVIPLTGYLPGEAAVLNSFTGMIGIPEQTDEGVKARCLLNPRLVIGGLVKINNDEINQTLQADLTASGFATSKLPIGQIPYNQYAGIQNLADISADGFYRLYVVEHSGDTRGQAWYSDLVCLSINNSTNKVEAKD